MKLRKRHTRRKSKLTPQAKGAITMAWKDNFDTIKSTAAVVAQSAAKKTRQLISVTKANLAILAEEDRLKKPTRSWASSITRILSWKRSRTRPNTSPGVIRLPLPARRSKPCGAQIDAAKDAGDDYVIVPVDVAYPDQAAETPEAEAAEAPAEDAAEEAAEAPAEDAACCDAPCACASDEAAPADGE